MALVVLRCMFRRLLVAQVSFLRMGLPLVSLWPGVGGEGLGVSFGLGFGGGGLGDEAFLSPGFQGPAGKGQVPMLLCSTEPSSPVV